jgi:integrase
MLIWRYLKMPESKGDLTLQEKLQSFLTKNSLDKLQRPNNLVDFVKTSVTWWSEHASSLDIQCATRTLISHGVHERTWARIHGEVYDPRGSLKNERASQAKASIDDIQLDDLLLLNQWLGVALEIIQGNDLAVMKVELAQLIQNQSKGSTSHVFLEWLAALLNGFSASKEGLALSTIRHRYTATAPRLLAILGGLNPAKMTTLELEDCYCDLTIDTDPAVPIRDLANGLRDFHAFLHRDYKKPLMRKEADVFGDENSLKPVDSNFITFDEYLAAQLWLDRKRMNKNERHIAKLVLMMAFRLGMRRMEIFGLQLRDIQVIDGLACLVRRNSKRRLKTTSSQRILPLRAFLTKLEQQLLLDWLEQRRNELPPPTSTFDTTFNFVFPKIEDEKFDTWVHHMTDVVRAAVRHATGDEALFLHHLRHAFGTWTYLRLRAPDFPEVARHFVDLPATVHALRTGMRMRVLLIGRRIEISRTYAYVVSRLMGHSSPVVSLGHYIHVADLLLGEIARRESNQLNRQVLLAASGLKKSAAFENLSESTENLLQASRNYFKPINNTPSDTPVTKKNLADLKKLPFTYKNHGYLWVVSSRH